MSLMIQMALLQQRLVQMSCREGRSDLMQRPAALIPLCKALQFCMELLPNHDVMLTLNMLSTAASFKDLRRDPESPQLVESRSHLCDQSMNVGGPGEFISELNPEVLDVIHQESMRAGKGKLFLFSTGAIM